LEWNEVGSLIEYFKKKTAENVLEKAINHARKVQECVNELDKGIEILLTTKDIEQAHEIFLNVDSLEGEADDFRRDIMQDISKGELNPSVRADLSHLIKRMDDVANCATGVARRLDTIPNKFWEQCSPETLSLILDMMKTTVECSNYLDRLLIDLLGERKRVREIAKQINQLEHKVDVLNINLRRSLQQTDYKISNFTAFTVGMTMNILEAISDSIEVVADYILVLLTSANVL
jgi:predicted phosphate transport protein (TIGR00153 family)